MGNKTRQAKLEQDARIISLWNQGLSVQVICTRTRLRPTCVTETLRRAGLTTPEHPRVEGALASAGEGLPVAADGGIRHIGARRILSDDY